MNFDNIILISIDALRYDCVAYQKRKQINQNLLAKHLHTPLINKLEKNAICFSKAFSVGSYTTSAHASLFTGLYPVDHHIRKFFNYGDKVSKKVETLAELFNKKGFATTAYSDLFYILKNLDILRGFRNTFNKDSDFIKFIKKDKSKKKFIFLHFFDVHEPYLFSPSDVFVDNSDYFKLVKKMARTHHVNLDSQWKWKPLEVWQKISSKVINEKKTLLPLYLQGITKFDKGRFNIYYQLLSKYLDMNKTIFVIFSDHGEGKNSYDNPNSFGHGNSLANEVLRIPLIIHSPSFPKIINQEILSIKDLYSLIKMFSKKSSFEDIASFRGEDSHIYAENWIWGIHQWPSFKEKKEAYYLAERAIINQKEKFILSFSPEYFIRQIDHFFFNRISIRTLMDHVLKYGSCPPRLIRYVYYFLSLISTRGTKIVLKRMIAKRDQPIFFYSKYNKHMEEKGVIPESKILDYTKGRAKVINLMTKIFNVNHKNIPPNKIAKFIELIQPSFLLLSDDF